MALNTTTAKPSAAMLWREISQLSVTELDRLACQLFVLRATKRKQALPAKEAELLLAINRAPESDARAAYRKLSAKRRHYKLSPSEHKQLLKLSDELEAINATRVKSLVALAALRRTTVPAVMESLGIRSLARN